MIPTLNDLEDAVINAITECEPGRFFTCVDFDDEAENELSCHVKGFISENGNVSVHQCAIYHYNADGDKLPFGKPDERRIADEASAYLREALQDARDIRETEDMLSWGGWFV